MKRVNGKNRGNRSLQQKLALAFVIIIACIMLIVIVLHVRTVHIVRQMTYEKMNAQAEYYQQTFETEIHNALSLQLEFFNDRKLPFLASPASGLSAYEERDSLLNVQERLRMTTGVTSLIEGGKLYIPGNNYCITTGMISRMTAQDEEELSRYLQQWDKSLQFDGENFYAVRTGETGTLVTDHPDFVFILVFSSDQVKDNLSTLNTSENSGAFIYNEANDVMLESSSTECVGRLVWEQLKRDAKGGLEKVQRLRIQDDNYLVLVGGNGEMGVFVQYVEEASLMEYIRESWIYVMIFLAVMIVMSVTFILYTRKIVHKPLNVLIRAFEKVKEGNLNEYIYHGTGDEFAYLYQSFNNMEDRLKQLIDEVYVQKNLAQKAQLKQLQAQINPHFLYNSFFILSRRIKRQDYDNAQEFAKHLGNYFKYLTRDGSDFIPLRQEVEHAKSYAAIQQVRFSDQLQILFDELPRAYEGLLVPRLILQPLLENAFEYGFENKVSGGILQVSFLESEHGVQILVEDNGEEASQEDIQKMCDSLEGQQLDEITGIVNIHRRLKGCFHGQAGLVIKRSVLGGVAIIIDIHTSIHAAAEQITGEENR